MSSTRAIIFRVVFFGLVFGLAYYIYRQIELFLGISPSLRIGMIIFIGLVFASLMSMPLYFFSRRHGQMSKTEEVFLTSAYYSLAYINFLIPLILFRDIFTVIMLFVVHGNVDFFFGLPAFIITFSLPILMAIYGHLNVRRGPQLFKRTIADARFPAEFNGLKIAQVSDLHISMFLVEGFVDKLVKMLAEVKADMVIFTGDIVDGPLETYNTEVEKLQQIKAPLGLFYVPGNHEYYWEVESFLKKFKQMGFHVLMNQCVPIQRGQSELLVCGIPDTAGAHFEGQEKINFDLLTKHYRENQYRLLLSHQPSQADIAVKHKIHAQFSGHTHAGQFFPWNFLIGFFQKYAKGLYIVKSEGHWLNLYVNQGTAYWGPAMRLGTTCELTLFTFTQK